MNKIDHISIIVTLIKLLYIKLQYPEHQTPDYLVHNSLEKNFVLVEFQNITAIDATRKVEPYRLELLNFNPFVSFP